MSGLAPEQIERAYCPDCRHEVEVHDDRGCATCWTCKATPGAVVAALIAEAVEEARKDIAQVVRNDALLWETLTADLALVASRNAPGWDAGEMAVVATRVIAARIARGEVSP